MYLLLKKPAFIWTYIQWHCNILSYYCNLKGLFSIWSVWSFISVMNVFSEINDLISGYIS